MKDADYLKGLPPEAFSENAAYFYSELNVLHPFREGNGRTGREFFRQLSEKAGYELDWGYVPKEEYMSAVIQTHDPTKLQPLIDVFRKCISPLDAKPGERWIESAAEQPLTFKDALKRAEGLPTSYDVDQAMLNQPVDRFKIERKAGKESLHVYFQDDTELKSFGLEKAPHLPRAVKDQWLDQAAGSVAPIRLSQSYEIGG